MEYICDLCKKECEQVYLKLSELINNDKMVFICEKCYYETEKTALKGKCKKPEIK